MKTNRLILAVLGMLSFGVGIQACDGGGKDDKPSFEEVNTGAARKDRMGRPALNTIIKKVLNTTGTSSDAFNQASPASDSAFEAALPQIVGLLHACPPATLGSALLPDVLTMNTTTSSGFLRTGGGRTLADDVFDVLLKAVYSSNGGVSYCSGTSAAILTDYINANDAAFSTTFPYLAAPH